MLTQTVTVLTQPRAGRPRLRQQERAKSRLRRVLLTLLTLLTVNPALVLMTPRILRRPLR
jgi:hypothetical protein